MTMAIAPDFGSRMSARPSRRSWHFGDATFPHGRGTQAGGSYSKNRQPGL